MHDSIRTTLTPTQIVKCCSHMSRTTATRYRNGHPVSDETKLKVADGTRRRLANAHAVHSKAMSFIVTTVSIEDINKPLPTIDECEAKYLAVQDAFRHVENVRRKEAQHIKGTHTDAEIMTLAEDSPAVNEAKLLFITELNREI